jgi:tetratricopeptide (TPR) repeat protein
MRANYYESVGKWPEAEKCFLQSLEADPEQAIVMNNLAYNWLIREVNLDRAKTLLDKAISIRPSDPVIMDSMGWYWFKMQQYDKAIPYLERSYAAIPKDSAIAEHLADAYFAYDQKTKALSILSQLYNDCRDPIDCERLRTKIDMP